MAILLPINFRKCPKSGPTNLNDPFSRRIIQNILIILARTQNTWRSLNWDEYVKERKLDGTCDYEFKITNASQPVSEQDTFNLVRPFTFSQAKAEEFCQTWGDPDTTLKTLDRYLTFTLRKM